MYFGAHSNSSSCTPDGRKMNTIMECSYLFVFFFHLLFPFAKMDTAKSVGTLKIFSSFSFLSKYAVKAIRAICLLSVTYVNDAHE